MVEPACWPAARSLQRAGWMSIAASIEAGTGRCSSDKRLIRRFRSWASDLGLQCFKTWTGSSSVTGHRIDKDGFGFEFGSQGCVGCLVPMMELMSGCKVAPRSLPTGSESRALCNEWWLWGMRMMKMMIIMKEILVCLGWVVFHFLPLLLFLQSRRRRQRRQTWSEPADLRDLLCCTLLSMDRGAG